MAANGSGLIKKGVQSINNIAEAVCGAEYWRKIAPGMEQLQKEVGEHMARNGMAAKSYTEDAIREASDKIARGIYSAQSKDINTQEFKDFIGDISKKISSGSSIDDILEEHKAAFGGRDITKFKESVAKSLGNQVESSPEQTYKNANVLEKLVETPKAYFTNPDKDIRKARIIGTGVMYAGAAVGSRYLTGGTLTRDSYGRKDIAGVPFV